MKQTPSYHYPDPFAGELRQALAGYVGCEADEVLVGNGGDEIISLVMNTFLNPGDVLLTHAPTFDIYGLDAEVLGAEVVTVPDLDGYRRDCDGFLEKIKELQPKVTVLCNPNNPTGELLPMSYVEAVLQASENPVVVDEAYLEFSGVPSIITKLSQYDNLIVIRTLSKAFGLAGCRVGYGVAKKRSSTLEPDKTGLQPERPFSECSAFRLGIRRRNLGSQHPADAGGPRRFL